MRYHVPILPSVALWSLLCVFVAESVNIRELCDRIDPNDDMSVFCKSVAKYYALENDLHDWDDTDVYGDTRGRRETSEALNDRVERGGGNYIRFGRSVSDVSEDPSVMRTLLASFGAPARRTSSGQYMRFGRSVDHVTGADLSDEDTEKRFMRFGRAFMRFGRSDPEEQKRAFMRFGRSGMDDKRAFMRFGRAGFDVDDIEDFKRFMRFGRQNEDDGLDADNPDKRFMRFGKRAFMRFGRDTAQQLQDKRTDITDEDLMRLAVQEDVDDLHEDEKRFMRFGKRAFMRFGKRQEENTEEDEKRAFMRFGKRVQELPDKRFMRFGKRGDELEKEKRFMRFGRKDDSGSTDLVEKKFMRFGKRENSDETEKRFTEFDKLEPIASNMVADIEGGKSS